MNQVLLDKIPDWYNSISPDKYYMVMSNDLDSLYSCGRLKKLFGLEVGGFYSFESGLHTYEGITRNKEPIFVDLSVSNGKSFDNHYTFIENPESINPNVIKREYYKKYCGSTLAVIMSLFGGTEKLNEKHLTTLLCIDGFYIGYYNNRGRYRDINEYWFDKLEISDYVLPILENHDMEYFITHVRDHQLKEEIYIDDNGYLDSALNIELPKYRFKIEQPVRKTFVVKCEAVNLYNKNNDIIYVSNEYRKNEYVLNLTK